MFIVIDIFYDKKNTSESHLIASSSQVKSTNCLIQFLDLKFLSQINQVLTKINERSVLNRCFNSLAVFNNLCSLC